MVVYNFFQGENGNYRSEQDQAGEAFNSSVQYGNENLPMDDMNARYQFSSSDLHSF